MMDGRRRRPRKIYTKMMTHQNDNTPKWWTAAAGDRKKYSKMMDRMMDDRHSSRKNKQMLDCLQTKAISHRPAQHNSIIINLTNNTPEKTERSAVNRFEVYSE